VNHDDERNDRADGTTQRRDGTDHMKLDTKRFPFSIPRTAPCIACATALVILYVCGRSALAQEPPKLAPAMDDKQKEMIELFGKVETRLSQIDRWLSDAGAGDTSALEKVGPAGLDELLKRGKSEGERAIQDIDRILELAQQMQQEQQQNSSGQGQGQEQKSSRSQQGGGQSSPQDGQGGQSPLDRQGETSTQREQTPTGPQSGDGKEPKQGENGKKPGDGKDPGNGQQPQNDPSKNGTKPMGKDASKDPAENRTSGPPSGANRGAATSTTFFRTWR